MACASAAVRPKASGSVEGQITEAELASLGFQLRQISVAALCVSEQHQVISIVQMGQGFNRDRLAFPSG